MIHIGFIMILFTMLSFFALVSITEIPPCDRQVPRCCCSAAGQVRLTRHTSCTCCLCSLCIILIRNSKFTLLTSSLSGSIRKGRKSWKGFVQCSIVLSLPPTHSLSFLSPGLSHGQIKSHSSCLSLLIGVS